MIQPRASLLPMAGHSTSTIVKATLGHVRLSQASVLSEWPSISKSPAWLVVQRVTVVFFCQTLDEIPMRHFKGTPDARGVGKRANFH